MQHLPLALACRTNRQQHRIMHLYSRQIIPSCIMAACSMQKSLYFLSPQKRHAAAWSRNVILQPHALTCKTAACICTQGLTSSTRMQVLRRPMPPPAGAPVGGPHRAERWHLILQLPWLALQWQWHLHCHSSAAPQPGVCSCQPQVMPVPYRMLLSHGSAYLLIHLPFMLLLIWSTCHQGQGWI